ncbi:hypothetical protein HUT16_04700 [Kitasatospora sp. NA04385]|nr:hypothetical protein HUT16_04700 [Kitasatospora sp. NA04385]
MVVGSLLAMAVFAERVAHHAEVTATATADPDGARTVCTVTGALFSASANDLTTRFDHAGGPDLVVIDLSGELAAAR